MPWTGDFARLVEVVQGLGVEAPKGVTAVLGSVEAFRQAIQSSSFDPTREMVKAIRKAGADGRPMDVGEARVLCKSLVLKQLMSTQLVPSLQGVEVPAVSLIQGLLLGDAGEELMGALRPVVDHAAEGIRRASEFYSADTTAERVLDLGPEAGQAWRDAEAHEIILNRVLNEVLRPLTLLELIDPELRRDAGRFLLAVWMIDPKRAHLLPDVGAELMKPLTAYSVPGGRWLKVHSLCGIHLNSPRQATEILREVHNVEARAEYARLNKKPVRTQ